MDWDVIIGSRNDDMRNTFDMLIEVKVPLEVVASLRSQNVQHAVVDYVAKRLHEYVEQEFSTKRLPPATLQLEKGKGHGT